MELALEEDGIDGEPVAVRMEARELRGGRSVGLLLGGDEAAEEETAPLAEGLVTSGVVDPLSVALPSLEVEGDVGTAGDEDGRSVEGRIEDTSEGKTPARPEGELATVLVAAACPVPESVTPDAEKPEEVTDVPDTADGATPTGLLEEPSADGVGELLGAVGEPLTPGAAVNDGDDVVATPGVAPEAADCTTGLPLDAAGETVDGELAGALVGVAAAVLPEPGVDVTVVTITETSLAIVATRDDTMLLLVGAELGLEAATAGLLFGDADG